MLSGRKAEGGGKTELKHLKRIMLLTPMLVRFQQVLMVLEGSMKQLHGSRWHAAVTRGSDGFRSGFWLDCLLQGLIRALPSCLLLRLFVAKGCFISKVVVFFFVCLDFLLALAILLSFWRCTGHTASTRRSEWSGCSPGPCKSCSR